MAKKSKGSNPIDRLQAISKSEEILSIKKAQLLEEALRSPNAEDILKAQNYLQNVSNREESDRKSYFVDPMEFQNSFGYKDKPMALSYGMLRSMAKVPVINAIIRTRVNQVAAFTEPQKNRYSIGYRIKKKSIYGGKENDKLTKEEEREIEEITMFVDNCGENKSFEHDDFDTFVRKIVRDSLTYDQMTFEVTDNKKGKPYEFLATDASTFRLAESYDDEAYDNDRLQKKQVRGYYPSYVQIYQSRPVAEFYPWELCFGVRNPSTELNLNGYGISELEEMVTTITSMLYGEEYNRRFFKNGSVPKGMLRIKGTMGQDKINAFRQQWNSTMKGVYNFWKTPILESDQAEWIDLQQSNRDMEYASWMEYLIKLGCAAFCIDPAEINFPLHGSAGQQPMFEGNNEARLKQSRDKGLYPILKFIQKRMNKYIVSRLNPKYEFEFVGLDAMTPENEQKLDIEAVKSYTTINEIRAKRGMEAIEGGDIVLAGEYTNALQQAKQQQLQEQQGLQEEDEGETPDFLEPMDEEPEENDAMAKAFEEFMNQELLLK